MDYEIILDKKMKTAPLEFKKQLFELFVQKATNALKEQNEKDFKLAKRACTLVASYI